MIVHLVVAFLTGLALGSYLPFIPCSIFMLLLLVGLVLAWLERKGQLTSTRGFILYGSLLSGVVFWLGSGWIQDRSALLELAETGAIRMTGSVVAPVRHVPGRMIMLVAVSEAGKGVNTRPVSGRLLLTWHEPDRTILRGDQIEVATRVRQPFGTLNPGGFDYGTYLKRKGIHAVASVSGPGRVQIVDGNVWEFWMSPWHVIDRWRDQVRQAAFATLQKPALGLYLWMIIGEQGFISPPVRDEFMATGTVHIISISGSHLGLIAFLSFFLIKGLCRRIPAGWLKHCLGGFPRPD